MILTVKMLLKHIVVAIVMMLWLQLLLQLADGDGDGDHDTGLDESGHQRKPFYNDSLEQKPAAQVAMNS